MVAQIGAVDYDHMTREQAIDACGPDAVAKVDAEGCDFSNRVRDDGLTEFTASIESIDKDDYGVTLTAYYYQDSDDVDGCDDLGALDWTVDHYSVR